MAVQPSSDFESNEKGRRVKRGEAEIANRAQKRSKKMRERRKMCLNFKLMITF